MVNFNGALFAEDSTLLTANNRGLKYGDALFETVRCVNGTVFFWEDHYFRLMASMRILRMEIPMEFTLEFLEEEIKKTIEANALGDNSVRIRLTVFRNDGGLYTPETNNVSYVIETSALDSPFYILEDGDYEVELFKDFYVNKDMLSTLKTSNKVLHVVASVFAKENGYSNCLLVNNEKQVVESINGNLFLVKDNVIKTPPLSDGCLDGIIRKKLMEIIEATEGLELQEASISPFELQKSDELFITNTIMGIQSISKYRKKVFGNTVAKSLVGKLNAKARISQAN
ncbi:aminotransferase class IV [Flagellimonas zhangzhouensis]|uniref:branched-chain-amino-acid transaminase n=1 Tax=Flagellimonas zhangzhouensis TaxID=1073328 RepID=A0A1H2SZ91_9FLAO|nr:aminotransferase class IV [Allomuricauda zhangzhouensis]SDQ80947.1 branched-chain amino acid aminotransferase [Allomuricauda zhangzhouensis]SDW36349.1 branched-chain amino acid aminotransferase [Allomuricauda zhangzhouensis]